MKWQWLLMLCLWGQSALAFEWQDLWLTRDQQGQRLLQQSKPKAAAKTFVNKKWQAVAKYRAGEYKAAAAQFRDVANSAKSHYNRGNSLAHLGQYEAALKAYEQALTLSPNDADAIFNRDLMKKLLKQQQKNKEQQNKEQQNKEQQNKEQQNKEQQNKEQQNKEQQNKEQQNKEQQNKDKQSKDQQNKDKQSKEQQNKDKQNKASTAKQSRTQREASLAQKQWLDRVPENPGGLLQKKFIRDYLKRHPGQRW